MFEESLGSAERENKTIFSEESSDGGDRSGGPGLALGGEADADVGGRPWERAEKTEGKPTRCPPRSLGDWTHPACPR